MDSEPGSLTKSYDAADEESVSRERFDFDSVSADLAPGALTTLQRFLCPEFLQRSHGQRTILRRTAYLDGLRGLAAIIVYLAHNLLSANSLFAPLEVAFGFQGHNRYLINTPFLRLLFTGSHVAVPIFFVISGYVQARKPIQQILEHKDITGTLASAIYRRPFRLYTPVIGSTLSFMLVWHLFNITPSLNHHEPTLLADLQHYVGDLWHWTYIFRSKNKGYFTDHGRVREAWSDYNGHSWTIPIELQGSCIVYLFLLTLSKATSRARIILTSASATYFLIQGSCYTFTFLAGSVLAELDASRGFMIPAKAPYRTACFTMMLVAGAYLGAPPAMGLLFMSSDMLAQHPGFNLVSKFVPWVYYDVIHFLVSVAAVLIIVPIMALPMLRAPFETRLLQYLGRISFSLYLVHGPILETLGAFMYLVVGKTVVDAAELAQYPWYNVIPVPKIGPLGLDLPFVVANMIILPVTLYVSELCMRLFDENSVWIARKAYEMILA